MNRKGNFKLKGCLIRLAVLAVVLAAAFHLFGGAIKRNFPDLAQRIEQQKQISSIESMMSEVRSQQEFLNNKLSAEIPEFRQKLEKQCEVIKTRLSGCTPAQKEMLDAELKEIAATLIALDEQQAECSQRVFNLEFAGRALDRAKEAGTSLGGDYLKIIDEINRNADTARVKLSVDIEKKIGSGAIASVKIQERFNKILSGTTESVKLK